MFVISNVIIFSSGVAVTSTVKDSPDVVATSKKVFNCKRVLEVGSSVVTSNGSLRRFRIVGERMGAVESVIEGRSDVIVSRAVVNIEASVVGKNGAVVGTVAVRTKIKVDTTKFFIGNSLSMNFVMLSSATKELRISH